MMQRIFPRSNIYEFTAMSLKTLPGTFSGEEGTCSAMAEKCKRVVTMVVVEGIV